MNRLFSVNLVAFLVVQAAASSSLDIIFALNAGGESFTDSNGIRYRRDYLTDGTASDYGKALDIKRVHSAQDRILYQTERYATETFGYTIPMPANDGDYVLWLKFSEVWFNAPNLKVFDVSLNDHIVIKDLDIFERVGRGVAHDELVSFQVRQGKLIINGKGSPFNNEIRVEFIKTEKDNPKVNAIIVVRGTADQVPELLPYKPPTPHDKFGLDEEDEDNEDYNREYNEHDEDEYGNDEDDQNELRAKREKLEQMQRQQQQQKMFDEESSDEEEAARAAAALNRKKKQSGAASNEPIVDPYAADETSYIIPILVAIGAFIPLLFCLCKI